MKNWKESLIYILPLLIVIGGIAALAKWGSHESAALNAVSTDRATVVKSCTTDMATTFHIHPVLTIKINGVIEPIPPGVGDDASCLHPLHTHDNSGTLHVESPVKMDFTLGDFFSLWGKTFTSRQILDSKVDDTHTITLTIDGKPSTDFENYVLGDKQQILIEYKTK